MSEESPKSAYELAMERLRKKDAEEGRTDSTPLTEAQKEEIAAVRRDFEAKIARLEIMRDTHRHKSWDSPEQLQKIDEDYRRDRAKLDADRDETIARIRARR